jgi:prevent-host-death family protein
MESRISATEAARNFSDVLNRVRYRGEVFVVERGAEPMCRITPASAPRCTVSDFVRMLQAIPRPDDGYLDIVESLAHHQPPLPKSRWPR